MCLCEFKTSLVYKKKKLLFILLWNYIKHMKREHTRAYVIIDYTDIFISVKHAFCTAL